MGAYNRYSELFEDDHALTAADLNAFKSDIRAWVRAQIAGLTPDPTPSGDAILASSGSVLASSGSVLASAG